MTLGGYFICIYLIRLFNPNIIISLAAAPELAFPNAPPKATEVPPVLPAFAVAAKFLILFIVLLSS